MPLRRTGLDKRLLRGAQGLAARRLQALGHPLVGLGPGARGLCAGRGHSRFMMSGGLGFGSGHGLLDLARNVRTGRHQRRLALPRQLGAHGGYRLLDFSRLVCARAELPPRLSGALLPGGRRRPPP